MEESQIAGPSPEQTVSSLLNVRAYVRDRLRLRFGAALASPIRTAQPYQIRLDLIPGIALNPIQQPDNSREQPD